ncbi:MAG: zinc-ribbon domain-containing protein [Deltaproteobacteria bacterium]|nr:zinc-ribbon domain-containing protein [Deltaproteobacteria bacterium]
MVTLTCPNCRFSAQISEDKIPAGAKWVKCPSCRQRFELNQVPPPPIPHENAVDSNSYDERHLSAWENRLRLGLLRGIFKTFKETLFMPKMFFRTLIYRAGIKEPFSFGLLFGSLGYMFDLFWQFLQSPDKLPPYIQDLLAYMPFHFLFFGVLILSPFMVIVMMFLTSLILHAFLLLVKDGKHGFEGTFRVVAFSQAANILGIIPFIGGFFGTAWYLIIMIIGLREMHETSYPRVLFAILIPVIIILVFTVILMITALFNIFTSSTM